MVGHIVRMQGMKNTPKWPGKLEHRGRDPKKTPVDLKRRDVEDFEGKRN
jgi:hypothetical protein